MYRPACQQHSQTTPHQLPTAAAQMQEVMREFRDIVIAYGESDEYSFVFKRSSQLYGAPQLQGRRCTCSSPHPPARVASLM